MARFAPVASPALLRYLVDEYPHGEIGGYHLMVANEVAEDPEASHQTCLLYTSPSPRDRQKSRMPSSA